jgi:hypothetical protein
MVLRSDSKDWDWKGSYSYSYHYSSAQKLVIRIVLAV